ncbi:MAG: sigma factor-like helix-turn-helix DNA-binding protein [Candidatus Hodgkinia cicadicola]
MCFSLIGLLTLSAKEARVVRLRGLADFSVRWPLKQVGFELGLTKERVRQLVLKSKKKLSGADDSSLYSVLAKTPI